MSSFLVGFGKAFRITLTDVSYFSLANSDHMGWNMMMFQISRWWFQISFIFTPGERIQFDLRIFFQVGWFNHQLEPFSRNDRGSTSWSSSYCRHRRRSPRGDWLNKVTEDDVIDVIGAYDLFPGTSPGITLEISIISLEHLPRKCDRKSQGGRSCLIIFQAMRLWVYILPGSDSKCKGHLGVPLTVYPWYLV